MVLFPPCDRRQISVEERARNEQILVHGAEPSSSSYKLLGLLPAYSLSDSFELCSCLFQSDSVAMDTSQTLIASLKCLSQWVKGGDGMDCLRQRELSVGIFPSTALSPKFVRICRS